MLAGFDLLRGLRHKPGPPPPGPDDYKKRMVAAAPVLTYGPTSGLGSTRTQEADAVDQRFEYVRFYETLYRLVHGALYLGGGFLYNTHRDLRPADDEATAAWPDSPYVTYSETFGFDPASQTSAGFSLQALLDSRDGSIGWAGRSRSTRSRPVAASAPA